MQYYIDAWNTFWKDTQQSNIISVESIEFLGW